MGNIIEILQTTAHPDDLEMSSPAQLPLPVLYGASQGRLRTVPLPIPFELNHQ